MSESSPPSSPLDLAEKLILERVIKPWSHNVDTNLSTCALAENRELVTSTHD